MKKFQGISASQGIVIGKVFFYLDEYLRVPEYEVSPEEVENEIERFDVAVLKTRDELVQLKKSLTKDGGITETGIVDAHIMMLEDPELARQIKKRVKEELNNVEWALHETVKSYIEILKMSSDEYLKERTYDIRDVAKRLLGNLLYKSRISLNSLSEEVIIVAHELLPSDALTMDKRMVKGIATDAGGKTSHTAILARAFEIPAVLGLSHITAEVRNGDQIIVDGTSGIVIIKPDQEVLESYERKLKQWQKKEVEFLNLNMLAAETRDGKKILLKANIEVPEETESVLSHGADGIGLYRSEFFFIQPGKLATEEDQYQAYSRVLASMENKSVTIRTIDLGGDKMMPGTAYFQESNPILGWRSIRFCMTRKDIFRTQIRALLRASVHGNLRIMFPMISGVEELDQVLDFYNEVRTECDDEGLKFDHNIPLGIMIEVPSAALTADILARKVKFFSIGTNDLIQYTIAVDRGNERVAYLYEPLHPGVLRLLRTIIEGAHSESIPVAMCGEMAGDPYMAVILLGLGLDVFSMSSFSIPEIKNIIRSVSMAQAEELVGTIFEMKSYKEIDRFVKGWMNERFEYLKQQ
ncbi:MAG: phosphoenolpyruvate--protein phosphotransferase [Spirochaetales bacterium]|nr:phosphoenolpyruvate--protein phosphotransferase [Spirochaetales bacterium]